MTAYYNEIDAKAASWLRELIRCNLIVPGVVDERSILDVLPSDLVGFAQCHFFAGIGVWSYALRSAGWPDDRPVWTGSCPCQPFSAAGKGGGFDDERHLWPAFNHLIGEHRPRVVFGEQVASKDGLAWLDLVQADMEGKDYAFGAFDLCAAGFGAPHIRQRTYWMADANGGHAGAERQQRSGQHGQQSQDSGVIGELGHPQGSDRGLPVRQAGQPLAEPLGAGTTRVALGDAERTGLEVEQREPGIPRAACETAEGEAVERASTGACNGHWSDADWLYCRDGKYRPVEPGTFPLAHGAPTRVGRLRGYGNAIVAPVAQEFIEAYMRREMT